jgi:hypothetical protein
MARFNRALKEQATYRRIFQDMEEVRLAASEFVEDYYAEWCIEENGFVSPQQAQVAWFAAISQQAA